MTKALPEQVARYIEMMSYQSVREVDTFDVKLLRSRLKGAIIIAKMVREGIDVFPLPEDITKALGDYNEGRYIELGNMNGEPEKEADDE